MSLTQNTYTPHFVCGVCGLEVQKIMVCQEAEAPGFWDCVKTLTDVRGLSAEELADEVEKTIDQTGENWCIQIFVWKNGFVELAPPLLLIAEK